MYTYVYAPYELCVCAMGVARAYRRRENHNFKRGNSIFNNSIQRNFLLSFLCRILMFIIAIQEITPAEVFFLLFSWWHRIAERHKLINQTESKWAYQGAYLSRWRWEWSRCQSTVLFDKYNCNCLIVLMFLFLISENWRNCSFDCVEMKNFRKWNYNFDLLPVVA